MFFYGSGSQLGTGLPSKIIPQSWSGEDTATGTLNVDLYTLRLGQGAPSLVLSSCGPLALGAADTAVVFKKISLLVLLLSVPCFKVWSRYIEPLRPEMLTANDAVTVGIWQLQLGWWEVAFTCGQNSPGGQFPRQRKCVDAGEQTPDF